MVYTDLNVFLFTTSMVLELFTTTNTYLSVTAIDCAISPKILPFADLKMLFVSALKLPLRCDALAGLLLNCPSLVIKYPSVRFNSCSPICSSELLQLYKVKAAIIGNKIFFMVLKLYIDLSLIITSWHQSFGHATVHSIGQIVNFKIDIQRFVFKRTFLL